MLAITTVHRHLAGSLVALALAGAAPLAAQGAAQREGFIVRLGSDTIAAEQFTRTRTSLQGMLVQRVPSTRVTEYTATLRPDGSVSRLEYVTYAYRAPASASVAASAAGAVNVQSSAAVPARTETGRGVVTLTGDSAVIQVTTGDSTRTSRVALKGASVPFVSNSFALQELMADRVRAIGRDTVEFATVSFGGTQAGSIRIARAGGDGIGVLMGSEEMWRLKLDASGRVAGTTPSATQTTAERVSGLDAATLASRFAAADAAGRGMGALSPRDTVATTVGAARLTVEYGRPAKRGRPVWGQLVPWNRVWRTGANQATHFTTTADLVINGVTVPAGTYTLYTLPSPTGWKLIVNRQTGQGGMSYDESKDLARIDMKAETLSSPVERFTIAIEPQGTGGTLALSWDTMRAAVPFTVKGSGSE